MLISEEQPGLFQEPAKQSNGSYLPEPLNGASVKNYVLDTNVLLHDPHCVYRFADNHVWIPIDVLSELDKFKNEQTERGANARTVHRFRTRCFNQNSKLVRSGARTPEGGTIRIGVNEFFIGPKIPKELRQFQQIFRDLDKADNRILAHCLYVQSRSPEKTILVSKDLNMQLKALAIGLQAQDYENDKVEVKDVEGYGQRAIEVDLHSMQRFASSRELALEGKIASTLYPNEYVFLSAGDHKMMPARHIVNGLCRRLNLPPTLINPSGVHLKPLNLGQPCLLDASLVPEIALVT